MRHVQLETDHPGRLDAVLHRNHGVSLQHNAVDAKRGVSDEILDADDFMRRRIHAQQAV